MVAFAVTKQKATRACCGCGGEAVALCTWRRHTTNEETGERTYSGEICKLSLCARCSTQIGPGQSLCAWHTTVAKEQELI